MRTEYIQSLIDEGREVLFYSSTAWRELRAKVMKLDHYECQLCKSKGRYRRGVLVHHVKHLRDRPDLALSVYDPDTGERQLVTVCKKCHEEQHPEALAVGMGENEKKWEEIAPERWD